MTRTIPPTSRCSARARLAVVLVGMLPAAWTLRAQDVLIEGTLRCLEGPASEEYRLARNTLVEPRGYPRSAVLTTDFGYYPLRLRRADVVDRTITIVYQGKDSLELQRLFVGQERLGSSHNLRLGALNSQVSCDRLEYPPEEALRRLDSLRAMGQRSFLTRFGLAGGGPAAAAVAAIVSALTRGAGAPTDGGPPTCTYLRPDGTVAGCVPDSTKVTTVAVVSPGGDETRGLAALALGPVSQNGGFGFAPSRHPGNAVVFGTAAVAGSGEGRASLQTDFNRFVRLSSLLPLGARAGLSAGYLRLDETKLISRLTADGSTSGAVVGRRFRLVSLGGAFDTRTKISAGASAKYIQHSIDVATAVERTSVYWPPACLPCPPVTATDRLLVNEVTTETVDFDVSALLPSVGGFQFGITVLNVLGTKLPSHDGTTTSQRAIGGGATYRRARLNVGMDALFTTADDLNLVFGANYVPLNGTVLGASVSPTLRSWQVGAQVRNIRYTFVRDPQWGRSHLAGLTAHF